jgi:hypothetical protein
MYAPITCLRAGRISGGPAAPFPPNLIPRPLNSPQPHPKTVVNRG